MKNTLRFLFIIALAIFSCNSEAKHLSEYVSLLQPNDLSNIDKTVIDSDTIDKRKAFTKHIITLLIEDDYNRFLNNSDTLFDEYIKDATHAQVVTVDTVYNTYKKNQIKGDKEYLNKPLLLIGEVEKIKSSVGNIPVVYLKTGKNFTFDTAHVFFKSPNDNIDTIIELEKGQKVAFLCIGGGVVIDSLVFNNCEFTNVYKTKFLESVLLDVDSYFSNFKLSETVFFFVTSIYVMSMDYPNYFNKCNTNKCKIEEKYLKNSFRSVGNILGIEKNKKMSVKEKTKLENLKVELWRLLISNKIVDPSTGKLLIEDYEMKKIPW